MTSAGGDTSGCPTEGELARHVAGADTDAERQALERHARGCPSCRAWLAEAAAANAILPHVRDALDAQDATADMGSNGASDGAAAIEMAPGGVEGLLDRLAKAPGGVEGIPGPVARTPGHAGETPRHVAEGRGLGAKPPGPAANMPGHVGEMPGAAGGGPREGCPARGGVGGHHADAFHPTEEIDFTVRAGQRIGNYHLKSVIGSGGMGTVFEAVQQRPQRIVALKVMNRAVGSASAVRRFQFEAQILGRLRHPNVAQVFEAGVHGQGPGAVPYFAMEYLPGARPLTDYATERKLDLPARLLLFAKVCDAVHHGHQKGVIHRDLKPANILVETGGEPKVIDFGVARATDSDLAITTQQTNLGQLIGTLQYMSPEQCRGDAHELDTRSDVYALGVVLYELLSGQVPYDLRGANIFEATRIIREKCPAQPSTHNPHLIGDVDAVVLKALEKDREQRYRSAAELAEDLRRVVNREPIQARPASAVYLVRRFVRRHPWQMGVAGLTICSLVLGSLSLAVMARTKLSIEQSNREASEQQTQAKLDLERSKREALEQTAKAQKRMSAIRGVEAALLDNDVGVGRKMLGKIEPADRGWEWRYAWAQFDQSVGTPLNTSGSNELLVAAAVSSNGEIGAAAFSQGSPRVELWSMGEPRQAATLDVPEGLVPTAVAISSDGDLLAVGADEPGPTPPGWIVVFARSSGLDFKRLGHWEARWLKEEPGEEPVEVSGSVGCLAFSPGNSFLAGGWMGGAVRLWRLDQVGMVGLVSPPEHVDLTGAGSDCVKGLAFDGGGDWLAAGSEDSLVRLWTVGPALEAKGGEPLAVLSGHRGRVQAVAFSGDGRWVASGSLDGTIRIWDREAALACAQRFTDRRAFGPGVEVDALYGHTAGVLTVAFAANGWRLVSGGDDRLVRVWDLVEGEKVPEGGLRYRPGQRVVDHRATNSLRGHGASIKAVALLRDGRAVSADVNGEVKTWWADLPGIPRLAGHGTSVRCVAFDPAGGNWLLSADADTCGILWNVADGVPFARMPLHGCGGINDLAVWRLEGRTLAALATGSVGSTWGKGRLAVFSVSDRCKPEEIQVSASPSGEDPDSLLSVAVSSNGQRLAAGDCRGIVRIWDVRGSKPGLLNEFAADSGPVTELLFLDKAGEWLASVNGNRFNKVYTTSTINLWKLRPGGAGAGAEHSDSEEAGPVFCLARGLFRSGSDDLLAAGRTDEIVELWTVRWEGGGPQLSSISRLTGHDGPVRALAFHPWEPRLVSGGNDRTIKIWDVAQDRLVEASTLRGHVGMVQGLAFDARGDRLASASSGSLGRDNVVWLWEAGPLPGDATGGLTERAGGDAGWKTSLLSPAQAKSRAQNWAVRRDALRAVAEQKLGHDAEAEQWLERAEFGCAGADAPAWCSSSERGEQAVHDN